MEQDERSGAARLRRHQRRAVRETRPGFLRQAGLGLGQYLPVHVGVGGRGEAGEGRGFVEGGQGFGLVPGQRAAERPPAAPQFYRKQVVGGARETRPGEADDCAAGVEEFLQLFAGVGGERHVGEDEDIRAFADDPADRVGFAGLFLAQVGVGGERLAQIVERRQQRLVGLGAADQADAAAARAGIEQEHAARRGLADQREAGDIVAQLQRQGEARDGAILRFQN